MLVTNQTSADIYFGPLHLGAGVGTQLTIDDTSATSLYLTDDSVADAVNNAYLAGRITVSSQAQPFPRPTGTPQLLHGGGDPEGLVYAPQGSLYMRRDAGNASGLYVKTTGVTLSTGWQAYAVAAAVSGFVQLYDSGYIAAAQATLDSGGSGFSTAFTHLRLLMLAHGDNPSSFISARLTFNGDNGTNYDSTEILGGGSATVGSGYATGVAYIDIGAGAVNAASSAASYASIIDCTIPFYSGSSFYKTVTGTVMSPQDSTSSRNALVGGSWHSTSSITRVTIAASLGNFVTGSRLMVYGYN